MTLPKKGFLPILVFIVLFLSSGFSIFRIFSDIREPAFDFHSYWYAGHFIWRGEDPYRAAFENREIAPPLTYLDGVTLTTGETKQFDHFLPANTAPVVFLLAPFARFSWPTATLLWAICNCSLAFLLAGLISHLFKQSFCSFESVLTFFFLISLVATRDAIRFGQTTLLILTCMIASIVLVKKHSFLSGLLLGIALSKYSLSLPVFLFFGYKRWYFPLAISIIVQFVGVLALVLLCHSSIASVSASYLQIMTMHLDMKAGSNLTNAFPSLENLMRIFVFGGTIGIGSLFVYWKLHNPRQLNLPKSVSLADLTLLNIGLIWDLLALYHRRYDDTAIILFLGLIIFCTKALSTPMNYQISTLERKIIYVIVAICCIFWLFPLVCIKFLGFDRCNELFVWGNFIALLISIWLLFRTNSIRVE